MTKKKRRQKKLLVHKLKQASQSGQVVSVDQMECTAPGFIAQLKGRLTTLRYKYATVFVDHHSQLGFVYLQRTANGAETLKAKRAFEAYCADHNVRVQHYHADNGRFCENLFINGVKAKQQTISF